MNSHKLLYGYSAVLTAALAIAALAGAAPSSSDKLVVSEIDVQRINIREPDGTLRMTISGKSRIPRLIIRGQEYGRERNVAGMLFFNDEGSETGGLIFEGRRADGKVYSSGSLSFDPYEQDQTIQILQYEQDKERFAGVLINDRPEGPGDWSALERARAAQSPEERAAIYKAAGLGEVRRASLARSDDKSAELRLRDAKGRTRLLMRVTGEGSASIQFLDEGGQAVRTVVP